MLKTQTAPTKGNLRAKTRTKINVSSFFCIQDVDPDVQIFTEVEPFYTSKRPNKHKGILAYHSLRSLVDRLNNYKPIVIDKSKNPAILKGFYEGGTTGDNNTMPGYFLPIDIDVKEKENNILRSNKVLNIQVYEYLQSILPLVFRSNSGEGIGGFLYCPKLQTIDKTQTILHVKIAHEIYNHLEELIFEKFSTKIIFDRQQGKFRQIRYLAKQNEVIKYNLNPFIFDFEAKTEVVKTSNGVVIYEKPPHLKTGDIKEQFNNRNDIVSIVSQFNCFDFVTQSRIKYNQSESSTSAEIKGNKLVVWSGTLQRDL
jgi:hypothetical protein